jgi:hypothetical protein
MGMLGGCFSPLKVSGKLRVIAASIFVIFLITTTCSFAQVQNEKNTNGFFPAGVSWFDEGAATTVFRAEPKKSESPDVGFYKEKEDKPLEEDLDTFAVAANKQKHDPTKPPPFDTKKATPEQLIAFYGKPEEDPAIPSDEKAPVPFKAMMAAMDSGNDELAYNYARQYVRYLRNTSERVDRTVKFQELALEREGIRPGNLKDNPYTHLLEKDFEKEETKKELSLSGIDPKAQRLIRQAEQEMTSEQKADENQIPKDPKGEVDAYLVFTLGDSQSVENAKSFQKLYEDFVHNQKITFRALSRKPATDSELLTFASLTGLEAPIQDGSKLVGGLGVEGQTQIILVAKNIKQIYRIKNSDSVSDMIEVIRTMANEDGL